MRTKGTVGAPASCQRLRYEYVTVTLDGRTNLKRYADLGWRLMHVFSNGGCQSVYRFKKPLAP